jgi:hypothetical protein
MTGLGIAMWPLPSALTGTSRSPPDRNSWRTTWSSASFLKPVAVTWIPSLGNPPTTRLALSPTRLLLPNGHFRSARLTSVTLSDSHQ